NQRRHAAVASPRSGAGVLSTATTYAIAATTAEASTSQKSRVATPTYADAAATRPASVTKKLHQANRRSAGDISPAPLARLEQPDEEHHPREVQPELEEQPADVAVQERLGRQVLRQERGEDIEDEEHGEAPRDQDVPGPGHPTAQADPSLEHNFVRVRLAER